METCDFKNIFIYSLKVSYTDSIFSDYNYCAFFRYLWLYSYEAYVSNFILF